jgi:ABC-type branched-subunit amino acid transport system substrate-binding protein
MAVRKSWISFLLVLTLGAASCQNNGGTGGDLTIHDPVGSPSNRDALVIGVVGTLSGTNEWRGSDAFEGANLGVSIVNRIPNSPSYELVTLDDRGEPKRAVTLVQRIVSNPRLVGVIFAGPPQAPERTRRLLARMGIPGLVCYSDLFDRRRLEPPLFQLSPPASWEAQRIIHYAFADRQYSRVGVLADTGSDGEISLEQLRRAAAAQGKHLFVARIDPGRDPLGALTYLRRRRVQAVAFAGTPQEAAGVIRTLTGMGARYRGLNLARTAGSGRAKHWQPQLLGLDQLLGSGATAAGAAPGTVAAASFDRNAPYMPLAQTRSFAEAFKRWWDHFPYGEQSSAYDAVRLIQRAAARQEVVPGPASPDRSGIAGALASLPTLNFSGAPLSFSSHDRVGSDRRSVGLWTVPGPHDVYAGTVPKKLDWIPLSRGFSGAGGRTRLPSFTWAKLFKRASLNGTSAPRFTALRFGVASPKSDPLH